MADKTTTLKTKTNDNVYPNVIGDNMDNAIVNSAHIKHTLTKDHKINFRLDDNVSNLIFNSLQKPAGLTKTKLVGVGTNGQENIEIGDNLTLANGKLSATGGGSGGDFDIVTLSENSTTYTGTISGNKPLLIKSNQNIYISNVYEYDSASESVFCSFTFDFKTSVGITFFKDNTCEINDNGSIYYHHFITMTDSSSNVALYLFFQDTYYNSYTTDGLAAYLEDKKVLANGNLHGVVPTYISGEGGIIKVYYMTPGDNNINSTPDEYQDLSSFTITDLVTPVE